MQTANFVESLRTDLEGFAAVGDDSASEAARRLTHALRGSAHLRLLDALGEAALEVSAQLPSGHVELRLSGQDAELVYVEEEQAAATTPAGEDFSARITLRLPDALKQAIEAAAAREGASVNAWIVRALARSISGPTAPRVGSRLTGFGRS